MEIVQPLALLWDQRLVWSLKVIESLQFGAEQTLRL